MPADPIFHLAIKAEWESDPVEYRGSTIGLSLADVGFIHASTAAQVQRTADLFYRGKDDVVMVTIDPDRLDVPVRYEEIPGGELFPHIYGPLSKRAVVSVKRIPQKADGRLDLGDLQEGN